jgi:hypothetical protein
MLGVGLRFVIFEYGTPREPIPTGPFFGYCDLCGVKRKLFYKDLDTLLTVCSDCGGDLSSAEILLNAAGLNSCVTNPPAS